MSVNRRNILKGRLGRGSVLPFSVVRGRREGER